MADGRRIGQGIVQRNGATGIVTNDSDIVQAQGIHDRGDLGNTLTGRQGRARDTIGTPVTEEVQRDRPPGFQVRYQLVVDTGVVRETVQQDHGFAGAAVVGHANASAWNRNRVGGRLGHRCSTGVAVKVDADQHGLGCRTVVPPPGPDGPGAGKHNSAHLVVPVQVMGCGSTAWHA